VSDRKLEDHPEDLRTLRSLLARGLGLRSAYPVGVDGPPVETARAHPLDRPRAWVALSWVAGLAGLSQL